jgi:BolA protein
MTADRITAIRERLENAFPGGRIQITDESHLHAGHAGARTGKGHFAVEIVTGTFSGQDKVHRHRLIYAALGDLMQTDIHALRIDARASEKS